MRRRCRNPRCTKIILTDESAAAPADSHAEAPADANAEAPADARGKAPADVNAETPADVNAEAPASAHTQAHSTTPIMKMPPLMTFDLRVEETGKLETAVKSRTMLRSIRGGTDSR